MGVFLGLDLGEKRVGVARSDESGIIAEALATIRYKKKEGLLKQLREYVELLKPEKVVAGLPETLQGEIGPSARKVLRLVEWLKPHLSVEWILWDERFTTVEAEEILREAGVSPKKRRPARDRLAAQRILQSYLNALRDQSV